MVFPFLFISGETPLYPNKNAPTPGRQWSTSGPGILTPRARRGPGDSKLPVKPRPSWRSTMTPAIGEEPASEIPNTNEADDDDLNQDRSWYDQEESGAVDETAAGFLGSDSAKIAARMADTARKIQKKISARQQAINEDNNRWEENRLMGSGVVRSTQVSTDFNTEEEEKVNVLVHDMKPPFLDSRFVYTRQAEPVSVVRDPTSDIAQLARKGSNLMKENREKQDVNKMRKKFWEISGSQMGNVLGVDNSKTQEELDQEQQVMIFCCCFI